MGNWTELFVRRPVLSSVVSLLILLVGLQAAFNLSIRQYPKIEETVITVTTAYPGANSDLVQGFITTPIAQAVSGAEGIDFVTSTSTQGTSTVTAHMLLNTDSNVALTEVMTKVQQVRNELPTEAEDPIIIKGTGQSVALMYLAFKSDHMSKQEVTEYLTRVVQPALATIEGVAQAQILGAESFAMRIWLDPIRLAARGVTADEVVSAVQRNNFQAAPGRTKGEYVSFAIRTDTTLKTAAQFGDLVIRDDANALIRLKDVAEVEFAAKSTDVRVTFDGEDAVFMAIEPTPAANPLDTIALVRAEIPELQRQMPPGMTGRVVYDATEFISASIWEVAKTIAEAALIVLVVILLFLGSLRSVVIPIVTIPLSLIGVCFLLQALGYSINLLTLLAMVLAIGLVVDDAIVVVENIHRHIEEGMRPLDAAIKGVEEIVGPVISMTITLAAVYAPIGFTTGLTGALFREFAFTLAGAVIISGVIALTLSPMMAGHLLKAHEADGQGGFAARVDRLFTWLQGWYQRRVRNAIRYRPVTAFFGAVILGLCGYLYVNTTQELSPEEDQGAMFIVADAPRYANIEYTDAFARQFLDIVKTIPESEAFFSASGLGSLSSSFGGLLLKPWDERERSQQQIQQDMQMKLNGVAGLRAFAFALPSLPGGGDGLPVQLVLKAPIAAEGVYETAERIADAARRSGMFIFVNTSLSFDSPRLDILVDRDKAAALGLSMADIGTTLSVLVGEAKISRFDVDGRSYDVIPQVRQHDRLNPESLERYYLRTSSGQEVPLSAVVSFRMTTAPNSLDQFNQLNASTISALPLPGVTLGSALDRLTAIAEQNLPQGFSFDYTGQSRQFVTEGNTIALTFGFALIVIYLVLAAQFESFRDPFIVLVSVPMSVCGALIPLNIGLSTINIYTQVGLITLIGLISKHGILMVDFANKLQDRGATKAEAIERAAAIRLRPILMTTAAMVMGVIPLITATGAGAAARFSIGLVIAAGMSIGTLFTLFVVPVVYSYLARDRGASRTAPGEVDEATVAHPAE